MGREGNFLIWGEDIRFGLLANQQLQTSFVYQQVHLVGFCEQHVVLTEIIGCQEPTLSKCVL